MVLSSLFPLKQVRSDGLAAQPIYLGNNTDSGISGVDASTLVKVPGGKCQPLASTPKPKPRLLVTAQQQRNELVVLRQGVPHALISELYHTEHPEPVLGERNYLAGDQV